jgi:site-specific DNA-methyltransferase (adenine-specific)
VAETMRAFRTMVGGSDMLAYLTIMAPRLKELHRVVKPDASLFPHCAIRPPATP